MNELLRGGATGAERVAFEKAADIICENKELNPEEFRAFVLSVLESKFPSTLIIGEFIAKLDRITQYRKALTPSADTKAAYTDCVDVPWTTIKEVMKVILHRVDSQDH